MSLVPCTTCQRHVRISDAACPFCAAVLPARAARLRESLPAGLKRAALFALGASLGAAPACAGDDEDTSDTDQPQQTSSATSTAAAPGDTNSQPLYGAPVGPTDPEGAGGSRPDPVGIGGIPAVQPLYGAIPAPIE